MSFKFKTSFASSVRCLTSEEKDKFLAIASLDELRKIIPQEFFAEDKKDLFPIASNLAVVNMANANDDAISTETALSIYKSLVHKYLNAEHKRKNHTIGHIINSGFSKFNLNYKEGIGSELLDESQIKDEKGPFNICYSAIIYKLVAPEIIDIVMESNNPESDNYLSVSSSWEIGFNEYSIVISKSKYLSDAVEIIKYTDERFAELDKILRYNGGSGKKDGNFIFRLLDSNPIFLGAALTTNPAASVAGAVFGKSKSEDLNEDTEDSQASNKNVINSEEPLTFMDKISKIEDINDDNLKKIASAGVIVDFINKELEKANADYVSKTAEQAKLASEIEEQKKKFESQAKEAKEKADKLEKDLQDLKAQVEAKAAEDTFNQRMAYFDEEYALAQEDRKIIAADLKDLDDSKFDSYKDKMATLLKEKSKKVLASKNPKVALASSDANAVVDDALAKAKEDAKASSDVPPNASSGGTDDIFSRFEKSFKFSENVRTNARKRA